MRSLLQFLAGLGLLLAEIVQLGLLLGRKDKALVFVLLLLLQFAQALLGVLQALLQLVNLGLPARLGLGLHLLDPREGPGQRGAAAHADEVAVAGHLLDQVLRQVQIGVHLS